MRLHDLRALQGQADATHAEERVFFFRDRPIRQRLVTADIQCAHYQGPAGQAIEHLAVFGFLGRFVRCLGVGHENQFGAQQADAFGTLLHRAGDTGAFADVGEHFHRVAIAGQSGLVALFGSRLEALLAGVTFLDRASQGGGIRLYMQATALAVQQQ